jgi:ketosteroid isomerase-like protein
MPSNSDVAEAFSRHRFDETYPHMLDDIEWTLVGGAPLSGKADVIAACEESAEELASARTTFEKFRVVLAAECVVIESQAEYIDAEGESSRVRSCDLYDFIDGKLSGITSYNIELTS